MALYEPDPLATGCASLDGILGGGLRRGELCLVYGQSGTGKTSLAIQCAVRRARKGLKTIFIDSDNTFPLTRLEQITGRELPDVAHLLFVFKPHTIRKQSLLVFRLDNYNLSTVALIVVDTVTTLYRAELASTENVFVQNMGLNWQLAYLREVALRYNIPILLTSQVRSVVQEDGEKIEPVANRILTFWAQRILRLEATSTSRVKKASLEKDRDRLGDEAYCFYTIERNGFVDANQDR